MERIVQFKSDNGKLYQTELDALKADAVYWKDRAEQAEKNAKTIADTMHRSGLINNPRSSYGSSGGGGHD